MADMTLAGVASLMQTEAQYTPKSEDEILDETMQFMGEPRSVKTQYAYSLISISNRLISELYLVNNACRVKNGKEPFVEYPLLTTMDDIVPFEYEIISNLFIYGLAYWLFVQDEENVKANAMLAQYNMAKASTPSIYKRVRSVV